MMAAEAAARMATNAPASKNSRFRSAFGSVALIGAICVIAAFASYPSSEPVELNEAGRPVEFVKLPGGQVEFGYAPQTNRVAGAQSVLASSYSTRPVQVRELGNGQVEMGIEGQRGRDQSRSSGFRPAGTAYAEGYKFARMAAPQVMSQGYFSDPARGNQVLRAEPQALSPLSAPPAPPAAVVSASDYNQLSSQLASIHQQQQQQLAADEAQENQMLQNAAMDPVVVANDVMRNQAAAMEREYQGIPAAAAPKLVAQEGHANQLAQAREQSLAEIPSSMEASQPEGDAAAPPAEPQAAVPSDNVAIQALQARMQADEVAISTLTKDVNELREQNQELQAAAAPSQPAPAAPEAAPALSPAQPQQ